MWPDGDDRTFIERAQSLARLETGKELSPEEMAIKFARLSEYDRVTTLDRMNRDSVSNATDDFPHLRGRIGTARQIAEQSRYERALRNTHEMLRKAGR